VWFAKYRLPDGRQVQKKVGPAWTERGRPQARYVTKRIAEEWLRDVLDQARRGTLPGLIRTDATFADAASEYLRYIEHEVGSPRRSAGTGRRSRRICRGATPVPPALVGGRRNESASWSRTPPFR
jgi:hypothetical protein